MRPVVDDIVRELLERHRPTGRVDLNDISEVIGGRAITYDEVEHIVDRLEAGGLRVAEPLSDDDVGVIQGVIASARKLSAALRRRPTVDEIALDCGRAPHTVRRALEQAQRVARAR